MTEPTRPRMARLLDALTHTGPGYDLTPATEHPMTEPRVPLNDLTSDQLDALYARIDTLEHVAAGNKRHVQLIVPDLEQAEAAIEQAELDAEQQARHFRTVCNERESYRQAWKYEQRRRAAAEAAIERVRAECTAITAEVYGQHDEDDDGMREAVRRIRHALGIPTDEPQPDPRCDAARAALDQAQQPTTTEPVLPGDKRTCCDARIGHYPTCPANQEQQEVSAYWRCAHCGDPITGTDWTWAKTPPPAEPIGDIRRFHVDRAECQAAAALDQAQQPTT